MVKREPNIIRGHLIELIWSGYVLFGLSNALLTSSTHKNPFVTFLGYAFIGLINIGMGIAQERFWRKQDQHRQQAARGEQSLVANFQPTPEAAALTLPKTITQRTSKGWTTILNSC